MSKKETFIPVRLIVFAVFLALFVWISISVISGASWITSFDQAVQTLAFSLRCDPLTAVLIPLTYSGNWQGVTAICILLLILPKTRRWFGLPLTGSAVTSVALYQFLKYRIERPRPDVSLHLIEQGGFSFPSGHTLSSILVWGTLILLLRHYQRTAYISPLTSQQVGPATRFRADRLHRPALGDGLTIALCVIAAAYLILMGLSRIYVGVHWPTDVLGSWCLGLALLSPISKIVEKI
ncbi:MAG: phosphatase PAP2 family protein [Firmicutes bacterium]|nr:phosphatase PAP2 family protein [Bacillota bacterium]